MEWFLWLCGHLGGKMRKCGEASWGHRAILVPFWGHLGAIYLDHRAILLGHLWGHLGAILGQLLWLSKAEQGWLSKAGCFKQGALQASMPLCLASVCTTKVHFNLAMLNTNFFTAGQAHTLPPVAGNSVSNNNNMMPPAPTVEPLA